MTCALIVMSWHAAHAVRCSPASAKMALPGAAAQPQLARMRVIAHVDLDAYYCQVEAKLHGLEGEALVVVSRRAAPVVLVFAVLRPPPIRPPPMPPACRCSTTPLET